MLMQANRAKYMLPIREGRNMDANARAAVEAIAKEHLGLETLETRKSDRLDFSDQAVWSIKAALEAAWREGFEAAKRPRRLREAV